VGRADPAGRRAGDAMVGEAASKRSVRAYSS
jgi:hypothetical protein